MLMDEAPATKNHAFTLTIDWLAFTLPDASADEVTRLIGGDWTRAKGGFRGYPNAWIDADPARGVGLFGTGSPRRPREVHVDLSAGIVSSWELVQVRTVLAWIFQHKGHITRLDCALDDRQNFVLLEVVRAAADAGQCITRADRVQVIQSFSLHKGTPSGYTIYFGSAQSQTLLRVYDKRLELRTKKLPQAEEYGIRWELEFKQDRAQLCGKCLVNLDEADWKESVVGLLRAYVDFRDTTRDAEDEARSRAPRLPWYESLTNGFRAARLTVAQPEPDVDKVKGWINRSVAPMLAALCALLGGQTWMEQAIVDGADRWKDRHRKLVKKGNRKYSVPDRGPQPSS
jgi:hypothetical protein